MLGGVSSALDSAAWSLRYLRRTFSKRVTSERACLSFQLVDPGMLVSRPQVSGRDETSHGVLGWYTDTIPRRVCQDLSPNTEIVVRRSSAAAPFISCANQPI